MARSRRLESGFQDELKRDLEKMFPGCFIMKLDSSYIQGIPDLLVLYKEKWAILECKKSAKAAHQPNQDYYVGLLDSMSFSTFIYPENKNEVLSALDDYFIKDWRAWK